MGESVVAGIKLSRQLTVDSKTEGRTSCAPFAFPPLSTIDFPNPAAENWRMIDRKARSEMCEPIRDYRAEGIGAFALADSLDCIAQETVMRNQRRNKKHSALREQLRREDAADLAKLTPAQSLQAALDLSDFCLMLAAKVREADAQRSFTKGRRGSR